MSTKHRERESVTDWWKRSVTRQKQRESKWDTETMLRLREDCQALTAWVEVKEGQSDFLQFYID